MSRTTSTPRVKTKARIRGFSVAAPRRFWNTHHDIKLTENDITFALTSNQSNIVDDICTALDYENGKSTGFFAPLTSDSVYIGVI